MREWTRVMWASSRARAVWEPRIAVIQRAWLQVEVDSVLEGLRPAGLVFGQPKDSGLPLTPVAPNRFAIGPAAADLAMAFRQSNNQMIGELLGYPSCCRAFFDRTWGMGLLDTTAQMEGDGNGPVECNILGRWMGVRFVMHLPCSWECDHTVICANHWKPLWPREALQWASEILSWPVQWSARNGIAEVVFPVCKLSTRGTLGETQTIRRRGMPPSEAATGVAFPFDQPRHRPVLIQLSDPAKANGFSSLEAMTAAHAMVLEELESSPPQGLTVDLGCGNGRLMRTIAKQFAVPVLGVEADPSRTQGATDIRLTNLEAFDTLPHDADTLVVSMRRFEEIPDLESWAALHARQVLVYSYDPPMFAEMKRGLR